MEHQTDTLDSQGNPDVPLTAPEQERRAFRNLQNEFNRLQFDLYKIYGSRGWRLLSRYYKLRERLLPSGSRRFALVRSIWRRARRLPKVFDQSQANYETWIKIHEPDATELERQLHFQFHFQPLVSIVVPVYQTPPAFLTAMVDSVLQQSYANWELCLVDGNSPNPEVRHQLSAFAKQDARIRVAFLPENRGIAGNSNAALELATGEFAALLDHDDTLAPFALFEVVRTLNNHPEADFIYSDEDHLDAAGRRVDHHFKPDWSPDTLQSFNYISRLVVIERDLLHRVGCFRSGFDGSEDYDLVLRATERAHAILHIPQVLYHSRAQPVALTGGQKPKEEHKAAIHVLEDHLQRCGIAGSVRNGSCPGTYQVMRTLPCQPLVSIVIPNRDQQHVLARCLESVARSTYSRYEILVMENGSKEAKTFDYYRTLSNNPRVRLLTWDRPFNYAAVNNAAARHAGGEVLLLLNNDTEIRNPDWLERMLEHALRPEVGIVGAKLYYPDGTIQHAGVILGLGGLANHAHCHAPGNVTGYIKRLVTTQNLSAVTGACAMLRRQVFEEIGGLDERFVLAYNDIDLCLQIRRHGYGVIWTPHAELNHYEQLTRGTEDTPEKMARFAAESQLFETKWADILHHGDPFYNPNLTLDAHDFSLRWRACGAIAKSL